LLNFVYNTAQFIIIRLWTLAAVILLEARIFGTLLCLLVDKLLDIAADIWCGLAF